MLTLMDPPKLLGSPRRDGRGRFGRPARQLATVALLAALLAGCGGGSDGDDTTTTAAGSCLASEPALDAAAREHAGDLVSEGEAERVDVDVCRSSPDAAKSRVTVVGLQDDSVRDIRHELTLERRGTAWHVTSDEHTQRCGRGSNTETFTAELCP